MQVVKWKCSAASKQLEASHLASCTSSRRTTLFMVSDERSHRLFEMSESQHDARNVRYQIPVCVCVDKRVLQEEIDSRWKEQSWRMTKRLPQQSRIASPTPNIFDDSKVLTHAAHTMASRATVSIFGADGSASDATHPLPNVFRAPIRPDIVQYASTAAKK